MSLFPKTISDKRGVQKEKDRDQSTSVIESVKDSIADILLRYMTTLSRVTNNAEYNAQIVEWHFVQGLEGGPWRWIQDAFDELRRDVLDRVNVRMCDEELAGRKWGVEEKMEAIGRRYVEMRNRVIGSCGTEM